MSTTTSALTIECAKPDCHWRGSPADAPTHPCPTPAEANGSGSAPADEAPRGEVRAQRFAKERADIEARLDAAGVSYSKDLGLDELKGLAQLLVDEPGLPSKEGSSATETRVRVPEPTLSDGTTAKEAADAFGAEDDGPPAYDSDPETVEDLGRWLGAHGAYDAKGVPADERTAELDARYGALLQEVGDSLASDPLAGPTDEELAHDPDAEYGYSETVDDDQADEPEVVHPGATGYEPVETGADTEAPIDPQPWQTRIADAVKLLGSVTAYKWLVVAIHTSSQPAELLGRGKTKNEAVVIQEDAIASGQTQGDITVVKTADVLKAAEQLEAATPDTASGHDQEESDAAPPAEAEAPTVEEAPVAALAAPTAGKLAESTLFDPADYRDPTLALPQIDGHDIDRIAVQFSGEIMLDRSDRDHVALWKRIKLGQNVELWVEAKGTGFAGKGATSKDGDLDVVVAKRTVTVHTLRVMGPEDLAEAALEVASQARDAVEAQAARDRRPNDA